MIEMRVKDRRYHDLPLFSFEFFPPRNEEGERQLRQAIDDLAPLKPDFVSVTYRGEGGSAPRTKEIVLSIQQEHRMPVMAHLTCVGHTRDQARALLKEYLEHGIRNILALRGDLPRDRPPGTAPAGELTHAIDLVRIAREMGGFSIGVAGFPEKHPEARTLEEDLAHLKAKVDAGAAFIITQLFFNNDVFFDYVAAARRRGVTVPIIPGIMPITSIRQIRRFREMCACTIPPALEKALTDPPLPDHAVEELGIAYCAAQCADLLRRGAPGIHFYTLNRSRACRTVLAALKALAWANPE